MSRLPNTVIVHQALARVAPEARTSTELAVMLGMDLSKVRRAVAALSEDGLVREQGRRQQFGGCSWAVKT